VEPILLNNLSKKPPEKYYACPHCLVKLDLDAENEKEVVEEGVVEKEVVEEVEPSPSMLPPSLEKVLSVLSANSWKEKAEEKEENEELQAEPSKNEKGSGAEETPRNCPHQFGYLAHRPKDTSIPQGCLMCPRIVECMIKL
jgi:hypothetical protein